MAEVVTSHFPDDVLIELFLKLPVRSLFIFRSVSKHWLYLIQNPNFINMHNKHQFNNQTIHNPMLIMRTKERVSDSEHRKVLLTLLSDDETLSYNEDIALELVSPTMELRGFGHGDKLHLIGPCNGLFCLTDTVDVVVFNPSTRQCRNVARSPLSGRNKDWYRSSVIDYFARVGFGFDRVAKDYKVVRFHDQEELDQSYDENDVGDNIDDDEDDSSDDYPYDLICKNFISMANRFKENDEHGFDNKYDKDDDDDDDDDDDEYNDFDDSDDDDYPRDRHMKVEIFSLSTNNWRVLDRVVPASYMPRIRSHNLFFNGAFHWLGADYEDYVCSILVFDLDKEEFKQFKLPGRYSEYEENICVYLLVFNKSLALIVHREDDCYELDAEFEIWVMRKYGVSKSWKNLYNISPDVEIKRPLSFSKEEFLAETKEGKLVSFNLKTKEIKEVQVQGVRGSFQAFRYREKLTSPN